jgi:hypothetical protein
VASVVIAAVGLLINSSIQRAQIRASEESTRAQIDVTDRNNKAQLALTERTADIQRHIQESTLTGQLVEHLASGSALKEQLAIVALRRSVPPDEDNAPHVKVFAHLIYDGDGNRPLWLPVGRGAHRSGNLRCIARLCDRRFCLTE